MGILHNSVIALCSGFDMVIKDPKLVYGSKVKFMNLKSVD